MFFTLFFTNGALMKFKLSNGDVSNVFTFFFFFTLFFPNGTLVKFKQSKDEVSNVFPHNALVNFKNKLSKEDMSNVFYLVFLQWYFVDVQAVQRRDEQCFLPCFSPMVLW